MIRKNLLSAIAAPAALLGLLSMGSVGCESTKSAANSLEQKMENKMSKTMGITSAEFGKTKDGQKVELYTLTNANGVVMKVSTYGAIITELHVPDKTGKTANVVLGFNNFAQYEAGHPFFGAIAGRYANRIAKGKFTLDGKEYTLATNNGPNSLHGGKVGFDKYVWAAEKIESADGPGIKLSLTSKDGDEGYPGTLKATCTYTLTNKNELKIDLDAMTDKITVCNLTNHSYFNLAGENSGNILDAKLTLNADKFTPSDATMIPTGELKDVKESPMDFTTPHAIGERIAQVPGGYDHNYVINGGGQGKLVQAGKVLDPKSGRAMEIWTTQPGVQFYTANFLDGKITGIGGKTYQKNGALCLETQHYPDSPNHSDFPTTTLKPGEKYHHQTVYKFVAE